MNNYSERVMRSKGNKVVKKVKEYNKYLFFICQIHLID